MKRMLLLLSCVLLLAAAVYYGRSLLKTSLAYISPVPAARSINPATSIAIREGHPLDPQSVSADLFSVVGSESGVHTGKVQLSRDQKTLLFYPDQPFSYNETVSVALKSGLVTTNGEAVGGTRWHFSTLERALPHMSPQPERNNQQAQKENDEARRSYRTHPEFARLRLLSVETPAQGTAEGFIFITQQNSDFLVIAENSGEPVYAYPLPDRKLYPADFKRQDVGGVPYLTYHLGTFYEGGYTTGIFYVLDQRYKVVDTWTLGNGYNWSDLHELLLLDNGDALLLGYAPVPYNLSPWGGPEDGQILDIIIQRQDADKHVIFEWRASDHIEPGDTYEDLNRVPQADILHTNSIEVDRDGNLLISNRHLSEVTKINHDPSDAGVDGTIMWRLGGKNNDFTFTNDEGFSYQHDVRRLPNGHILLFDNGVYKSPKEYSRVVEYEIDEENKTVTRVWQYPNDKNRFAAFAGNSQRLSNGNTLIGWGALPTVTEVTPDGTKALELSLNGEQSYRSFRFQWEGLPDTSPVLVVETSSGSSAVTLYFSWNGATDITEYEIYVGPQPDAMRRVKTVERAGFETAVELDDLDPGICVFKVRPVHRDGRGMPYSNNVFRRDRAHCRALVDYRATSGGVAQ